MPRVKPRKGENYSSAPVRKAPRIERTGHLVQEGEPKGKLKELLATPARPREEELERELRKLAMQRVESDSFLRAMTEGEE